MIRAILKKLKNIIKEKPSRFYEIDGFKLDMGQEHNLSLTQKYHPMYDKINPYLARLAEKKGNIYIEEGRPNIRWIVDIGANVGDTTAAMIRHTNAKILCVEPTKYFFDLLQKNVVHFGNEYENKVELANCYIALNATETYISDKMDGTAIKRRIENEETSAEADTFTLIDLVNTKQIPLECIDLIKIDTDGYDSECVMSLGESLSQVSPCLYWENQIDTEDQFDQYIKMSKYLAKMGYTLFFVFDNFGNYLCKGDARILEEINFYLLRILKKKSTRSFYYVDVLACKKEDEKLCEEIVKEYLDMK